MIAAVFWDVGAGLVRRDAGNGTLKEASLTLLLLLLELFPETSKLSNMLDEGAEERGRAATRTLLSSLKGVLLLTEVAFLLLLLFEATAAPVLLLLLFSRAASRASCRSCLSKCLEAYPIKSLCFESA